MKKIQVIGLPGSGKTTAINLYTDGTNPSVLDICNYIGPYQQQAFAKAITVCNTNLIAESACGISTVSTYIIKLEIKRYQLLENLIKRNDLLEEKYINYLVDRMLPANYTVDSTQDLVELLTNIFKRY